MADPKQTLPLATPDALDAPSALAPRRPSRAAGGDPEPWVGRARALIEGLENAIAAGPTAAKSAAAAERAYAAFFLDAIPDPELARVAHICERAHEAIRKVVPSKLDRAAIDCALVLRNGLPAAIQSRISIDQATQIVHVLCAEPVRSRAVAEATARLLGWVDLYRDPFEQAVLTALREFPPESSR